jgi:hypothetical protein
MLAFSGVVDRVRTKPTCTLLRVEFLGPACVPTVTLAVRSGTKLTQQAFSYDTAMACWCRVADAAYPASAFALSLGVSCCTCRRLRTLVFTVTVSCACMMQIGALAQTQQQCGALSSSSLGSSVTQKHQLDDVTVAHCYARALASVLTGDNDDVKHW